MKVALYLYHKTLTEGAAFFCRFKCRGASHVSPEPSRRPVAGVWSPQLPSLGSVIEPRYPVSA